MWTELDLWCVIAEPISRTNDLHGLFTGLSIESIDENDAVEMICLVLHATSHQFSAFENNGLAVHVHPSCHHAASARSIEGKAGQRKTALVTILEILREGELGIAQMSQLVIDPIGEDPQRDTDLGSSETRAGRMLHGLSEILHQLAKFLVEGRHRRCGRAEHGIPEDPDRLDGHGTSLGSQAQVTWIAYDLHNTGIATGTAHRIHGTQVAREREPVLASRDQERSVMLVGAEKSVGNRH